MSRNEGQLENQSEVVDNRYLPPLRQVGSDSVSYHVSSAIWENDGLKKASSSRRRKSMFSGDAGGMTISGISQTPEDKLAFEAEYALEESWPLPNANKFPLIAQGDVRYRIPRELWYAQGPDIRVSGYDAEIPKLHDVLRNLDKCRGLSSYPPDVDMDSHVIMLDSFEGARASFRQPVLEEEFNAPVRNEDADYGYWPSLVDSSNDSSLLPVISDRDINNIQYYRGFEIDLTKDYSAFFPEFPYVAKDHPNRYFADIPAHIRDVHPVWGMFGRDVLEQGWNAFAQERFGQRLPTSFCGDGIWQNRREREKKRHPTKLSILFDICIPPASYISWSWSVHSPEKNIAILMGKACGNIFALDIDVTDRLKIGKILEIIENKIGLSPFIRVGSWPKVALLYRLPEGETMRSRSLNFTDNSGAFEILSEGKPLTAYGVHHSMKSTFQWIGSATPCENSPLEAPRVTEADINDILDEIEHSVGEFAKRNTVTTIQNGESVETFVQGEYIMDGNGIVIDGRSAFARDVTFDITRRHRDEIVETPKNARNEITQRIAGIVVATLGERMLCDGGRWSSGPLERSVLADVSSLVNDAEERLFIRNEEGVSIRDHVKPIVVNEDNVVSNGILRESVVETPVSTQRHMAFLGKERLLDADSVSIDRNGDAIPMPSPDIASDISHGLKDVVGGFMSEVYHGNIGEVRPVVVVDAPTGAGKTSRTIEEIVLDPRTLDDFPYYDDKGDLQSGRCPFVIAMPTYANINEAVSRARILCLSPALTDEELVEELVKQDCVPSEDEAHRRLPEIRRLIREANRDPSLPPLDIQVYTGREQAGCPYKRNLALLAAAKQPADRLCKAEVEKEENGLKVKVTEFCPRYDSCAYIAQKESVKTAHIVFIPHAFVGNGGLPDSLTHARALIIDEQIHNQFLHVAFMEPEDFTISPSIFRDWKMPENPTALAERKTIEHNERMAELRMAIPARAWILDILSKGLEQKIDPAEIIRDCPDYMDTSLFLDLSYAEEEQNSVANFDANEFEAYVVPYQEGMENNHECISAYQAMSMAIDLLESFFKRDMRIKPELLNDRVVEKLTQPGVINAERELMMWTAIKDRMHAIFTQEERASLRANSVEAEVAELREMALDAGEDDPRFENWEDQARRLLEDWDRTHPKENIHKKDSRFQSCLVRKPVGNGIEIKRVIRFSWRTNPGWDATPVMLLDASASPEVISRVFSDRQVLMRKVVEDTGASLNMKIVGVLGQSFSNTSLVSSQDASILGRVRAAINLDTIRSAISMVCANHGDSRVVFGASKRIREALITGWVDMPESLDSCHFGAMRGIDAYKKHMASVCVGRMEPPIEVIDAYAACLSWDDDTYEAPYNIHGNGYRDEEQTKPLIQGTVPRLIRLRDGGTVTVQTPVVDGKWGKIIQSQVREEEINQFIGRLRPVYRQDDEIPTCYVVSSIVPNHLILDEIIDINDFVGADGNSEWASTRKSKITPVSIRKQRLRKFIMSRIIRAAFRNKGFICLENFINSFDFLLDLPSQYHNLDFLYEVMSEYGFHRDGHFDENISMADGWICMTGDSEDGSKTIWGMVGNHESAEDAVAALKEYVMEPGENGEGGCIMNRTSILSMPSPRVCFTREMDATEEKAMTGYVMHKTAMRGAMTQEEIDEAQYEASLHRRNMKEVFQNIFDNFYEMSCSVIHRGRWVKQSVFKHVSDNDNRFLIHAMLLDMLVPGCRNGKGKLAQDFDTVKGAGVTKDQFFALMSIQEIFLPKMEDVFQKLSLEEAKAEFGMEDAIPNVSAA